MPKTIKYIGTQDRWPEISVTGRQSVWGRGQEDERSDVEAAQLLATGLFKDLDATRLPEPKVQAISGVVSEACILSNAGTAEAATANNLLLQAAIDAVGPGLSLIHI